MDAASLEVLKVMLDGGFEQPDVLYVSLSMAGGLELDCL